MYCFGLSPSSGRKFQIALAIFYASSQASAQHTEVTCTVDGLSWAFNSLGQSPCLVAAYLGAPCSADNDFDVPAIPPTFNYETPLLPTTCVCSTVFYCLINACAACQAAQMVSYTFYSTNCSRSSLPGDGTYPLNIPPKTAVPAWAFQSVHASNNFNISLAKSVGDMPERVATSNSTSTSSVSPPTSSAGDNPKGTRGSNAGVIAGSVVGGVIGLALILALLTYFIIRERRKSEVSSDPPVFRDNISSVTPQFSSMKASISPDLNTNRSLPSYTSGTPVPQQYDPTFFTPDSQLNPGQQHVSMRVDRADHSY